MRPSSGAGGPAQGIRADPIRSFRREQVRAKRIERLSHVIGFRRRKSPFNCEREAMQPALAYRRLQAILAP